MEYFFKFRTTLMYAVGSGNNCRKECLYKVCCADPFLPFGLRIPASWMRCRSASHAPRNQSMSATCIPQCLLKPSQPRSSSSSVPFGVICENSWGTSMHKQRKGTPCIGRSASLARSMAWVRLRHLQGNSVQFRVFRHSEVHIESF